ncbi:high mobility group protein B3 [Histomonas meleagridis]|uniref:high mobility group protein B3 n=1 Tax=Histomonas meleagridis TaxID=135588 RepID=UPI0035598DD9|nr:high mobility group protein B3 [Histomonas meleagridis]KAH0803925.1 high mobility group protein B3 [Histomonas meleagridis]
MPKTSGDKPKRPRSGYLIFQAEVRPKIVEENPDILQKEIMKKVGQMWRDLSDEEKKVYNEKAAAEKAQAGGDSKKSSKKAKKEEEEDDN